MGWKLQKRERYGLIEQDSENPRKHRGTFYVGPRHVKHRGTGQFVEIHHVLNPSFASEPNCRAFAQTAHIALEFYDEHVYFFDPDYTRKVCRETWMPQAKIAGEWATLDTVIVSRSKTDLEDGVKFSEVKDVYYETNKVATLTISYILRIGAFLKHEITLTNLLPQTQTVRMVQTLIGIAGKRVIHALGEEEVTVTEKEKLSRFIRFVDKDNPRFQYLHENLASLGHDEINAETDEEEWVNDKLRAIRFKLVEWEGKTLVRCDIVIGNYTLAENESLLIDPDSSTIQVSAATDDATVYNTPPVSIDVYHTFAKLGFYNVDYYGQPFRTTGWNIPAGATIVHAYVYMTARTSRNVDMDMEIKGEEANGVTFSTIEDYNGRQRTTAVGTWDFAGVWSVGVEKQSSDIASVIQEILDDSSVETLTDIVLFVEDMDMDSAQGAYSAYVHSYDSASAYAPKLYVEWTSGGQTYEINVDAVVKASAEKSLQTTYNIAKDAAVTSQALKASETIFNIQKDAITKALTTLTFELGIPIEAVVQASATPNLESTFKISKEAVIEALATKMLQTTYNIHKDAAVAGSASHGEETTFNISKNALVQALADVVVEKVAGQLIEIFKDAVVKAQATFSLESTFNINKDAISEVTATVGVETIFNVVKDAIVKASASPQVLGVYPINVDAVVKASATASLQQTLGISKDAVVVAVSTPLIQSTFNISKDAVVKVLAEVSVVKEGEVKVTKLFLMLGNLAIQIQG